MREIEIKAKVIDLESFRVALLANGIALAAPVVQVDRIFIPKGLSFFETAAKTTPILRIRSQGDAQLLTLKRDFTGELDSIEYETRFDNCEEMIAILNELRYNDILTVRKRRQKGFINDIHVCVDEVDELGAFVEVETIANTNAVICDVRRRLWDFLTSLGIDRHSEVFEGYDRLLSKQQRGNHDSKTTETYSRNDD